MDKIEEDKVIAGIKQIAIVGFMLAMRAGGTEERGDMLLGHAIDHAETWLKHAEPTLRKLLKD